MFGSQFGNNLKLGVRWKTEVHTEDQLGMTFTDKVFILSQKPSNWTLVTTLFLEPSLMLILDGNTVL